MFYEEKMAEVLAFVFINLSAGYHYRNINVKCSSDDIKAVGTIFSVQNQSLAYELNSFIILVQHHGKLYCKMALCLEE